MRAFALLSCGFSFVAAVTAPAFADDVGLETPCDSPELRCSEDGELVFDWQQTAFSGVDIDTGWRPANSNVQARFAVRLLGNTQVSFGGGLTADWGSGDMLIGLDAEEDAGWVSVGYGLEIAAQLRFNVSVLGRNVSWTGSIPTPLNLPSDLLVAAETDYTPWLLPGGTPEAVAVSDETGRVSAFVVGLSDDIIDVPGIGGHFALQVAASLEGEYRDESVAIDGETIDESGAKATLEPDDTTVGFGAALRADVQSQGRLTYTPGVTLYPNVRLVVLGFTVINQDLFSLHLDLPSFSSQVDFNAASAELPLPDLRVFPERLQFDDGATEATLTIENRGDRDLIIDAEDWPAEFEAIGFSAAIEPGAVHELHIALLPEVVSEGRAVSRTLSLRSNDPDAPVSTIDVDINIAGPDETDDESGGYDTTPAQDATAGCGCESGGSESGTNALLLVLVLLVLLSRRRDHERTSL